MHASPNIVFLTWHDAGDWFGCHGHRCVQTPNVDRLAAEGVRFTSHFSACAICSPSRAAMMTGRLCQVNGVMTLTNDTLANRIHPHIPHLAARLKDHGYRTALFGVQHECAHEHVGEILRVGEQFATDPWPNADLQIPIVQSWLAARAADSRPFYAQIGLMESHLGRFFSNLPPRPDEPYPPIQDSTRGLDIPGYLAGSDADRACIATLQGLLQRGDRLVGAVLDALDRHGLAASTLVVMAVDHGPGLARAKATCYDAGTRVAWILRHPGSLPQNRAIDTLSTHIDATPTILALAGLPVTGPFDGIDLSAHARGARTGEVRDAVFSHMVENTRALRTRRWRFIRNFRPSIWPGRTGDCALRHDGYPNPYPDIAIAPAKDGNPARKPTETEMARLASSQPVPHVELYDAEADPANLHDLAGDPAHAATLRALDDRLWQFLYDANDFILHDPVRTPWQAGTRAALEAWCARAGRRAPFAEGPLANPLDLATSQGRTHAQRATHP